MSSTTLAMLIGICILVQGFFSGSEMALVSADRVKLRAAAGSGQAGAKRALALLERPTRVLATCLLGTTLCTTAAATLGAEIAARHFGGEELWAVLLVVPFSLTFGEVVPKAIYQHYADRLAPLVVEPLSGVAWLLRPFVWFIDGLASLLHGPGGAHTVTREDIRLLLDGAKEEAIKPADKAIIQRVFAFSEATVRDVMVPLIEIHALSGTATCADAARRMVESGHSRLPVYQDRIDRIAGILLHQDLMEVADWNAPASSVARPPYFVPETKRVDQLFAEMRRARQRLAVIVDEYGGAVGILTVEDLLEEIVGDIQDESDRAQAHIRRTGPHEWAATGRAEREHLLEACGLTLPAEGDYETLAGYLLDTLGHVPRVGERVTLAGFTMTVSKASDRAILEVTIRSPER